MGHPSERLVGVDKVLGPSFLATVPVQHRDEALEALALWSEFRTRKKTAVNRGAARSFHLEVAGRLPDPAAILRWVGAYFDWQAASGLLEANPGFSS